MPKFWHGFKAVSSGISSAAAFFPAAFRNARAGKAALTGVVAQAGRVLIRRGGGRHFGGIMEFASDNAAGVAPAILDAIARATE